MPQLAPASEMDPKTLLGALNSFRRGDFSVRLPEDWTGLGGKVADAFNEVVELNERMAAELERLSQVVGKQGRINQRASLGDVRGSWASSVQCVNALVTDLVHPTTETARVIGAVAKGDLSQTMALEIDGRPLAGEFLRTARIVNTMVEQLGAFAAEVTRVAREVGTEGKLGGQAKVRGVAGTWKDLTDSVNLMASNLTGQVRNIAAVTTAVAKGDLSKKITVDVRGEILELKDTINTMVDQLRSFASEVTRVAREVGTEGRLGGQADVKGVAGTWKDLTDSVNFMAGNLTSQVRNIADVTKAVANGDLSKKITVDVKGEILELKDTINTMVDQLRAFASEVTRVAREVGTEGRLGGQAAVPGVGGTWKDLTDNVNLMASNLTSQVRNIAEVTTAVAGGDLTKKITVDVKGEILELKDTINTMVDQLRSFASEVTRVAREVGTEGKLGGQAAVPGVAGTWKDLTDNVNFMASNLTSQVRNIADVTKAVAKGDLSEKITVDVRGEILELKNTINTMVDQLSSFASEVTRVAREVGTDGKLGGQADVKGVAGTWKDLTDSVNFMASNLTSQVRNIAAVTTAVAGGDLSKKITVDVRGEILELKDTINTMVDQLRAFASEVTRVAREVGTEGKLGGQAAVPGVAGTWKDLTDNVNFMASNLTSQVRNIADVTKAVANGDLSRKITVDVKGEILELKDTINTMVDQLRSFASEVTRVAREVGTEGKLGGQAAVPGVAGTWKDLTDNVNFMASNLTNQVRGIAQVVTAVANGNLRRKLTVEAKGEIAALSETINNMIDTLATFADQVTTVAREVGVEGKLGGQAAVPGAAGTWKDLTDNVNQLAANLTTQVRAIAEVATAVTQGDLTRSIQVQVQGELEELKNNINEMIRNLKETTLKNAEQDWLKTNLAKFTRMLQGQRDLLTVGRMVLSELAPLVEAKHGVFYTMAEGDGDSRLQLLASYAFQMRKNVSNEFRLGEGLVGQAALEKQRILLTHVPPDYIHISSGLGEAVPLNIVVLPVIFEGELKAVMELASFDGFSPTHLTFLEQLTESIGIVLNTIQANSRTEDLLRQSQSLAGELQSQQKELQQTNEQLEEKARLLAEQNMEVERKNQEVEQARQALEEKATQLALTSKYKSEFLANMSHELRTPLNSLLILADQLGENPQGNLTARQVEFAQTIHASGRDLLALINDILDLSKIESGTVTVDVAEVGFGDLADSLDRSFRHMAESKGLDFQIHVDALLPPAVRTDGKRLQQVMKNLLANAFKFTDRGAVTVRMVRAESGWSRDHAQLRRARQVASLAVSDTGIGIDADKQQIIFEAFQQADGGTSRRYGGTGLGLAISREISRLLGGELRVESAPGRGSTFTLYLPVEPVDLPTAVRLPVEAPAAMPELVRVAAAPLPADDRSSLAPGDRVLLVVEDDPAFAGVLADLGRERGFKVVVATRGADAISTARDLKPDAITFDVGLPDLDGWRVLERLKDDPATRHIPLFLISAADELERSLRSGAVGFLAKPVDKGQLGAAFSRLCEVVNKPVKSLLLLESDGERRAQAVELLGNTDIETIAVGTAQEALDALSSRPVDCMVLGVWNGFEAGLELLPQLKKRPEWRSVPVVLYGDSELSASDDAQLRKLLHSLVVREARSPERLLDETARFLHRDATRLPEPKRAILERLHSSGDVLAGHTVLIVDDDVRNIFAMTSLLERHGMQVVTAENGREALERLEGTPEVDLVLMDVMLPEMDGYETTRAMRRLPGKRSLPILALTAKAMKGDREKCIEAGASDYIAKPVEADHLLAQLRSWLYR
jgi:HAMP domain-containing protein/signal transduction histidine kinase/DNA-binding response OmpR family regulator